MIVDGPPSSCDTNSACKVQLLHTFSDAGLLMCTILLLVCCRLWILGDSRRPQSPRIGASRRRVGLGRRCIAVWLLLPHLVVDASAQSEGSPPLDVDAVFQGSIVCCASKQSFP